MTTALSPPAGTARVAGTRPGRVVQFASRHRPASAVVIVRRPLSPFRPVLESGMRPLRQLLRPRRRPASRLRRRCGAYARRHSAAGTASSAARFPRMPARPGSDAGAPRLGCRCHLMILPIT